MPRASDPRAELRAKLKSERTMVSRLRREREELRDEIETMGQLLSAIISHGEARGVITYDELCDLIGGRPTPRSESVLDGAAADRCARCGEAATATPPLSIRSCDDCAEEVGK